MVLALLLIPGFARAEKFSGQLWVSEDATYLGGFRLVDNEHTQRLRADAQALGLMTVVVEGSKQAKSVEISNIVTPRPVTREGHVLRGPRDVRDGLVLWCDQPEVYRVLQSPLSGLLRRQMSRRVVVRGWERTGTLVVTGILEQTTYAGDDVWVTDSAHPGELGTEPGSYTTLRGTVVWDAELEEHVVSAPSGMTRLLVADLGRPPLPLLGAYEGMEIEVAGLLLPPQPGALGVDAAAPPLPKMIVERSLSPRPATLVGTVRVGGLERRGQTLTIVKDPPTYRQYFGGAIRVLPGARLSALLPRGRVVKIRGWAFREPGGALHAVHPTQVQMAFRASRRSKLTKLWVGLYDLQTDQVFEAHSQALPYARHDLTFPHLELASEKSKPDFTGLRQILRDASREREN